VSYAAGTSVSVESSKAELYSLLKKHGATQSGMADDDTRGLAIVFFMLQDRHFRIEVPMPKIDACRPRPNALPHGWVRWDEPRRTAWVAKTHEQKCRERWRLLVLAVKAKLELVALGFRSAEQEFLADLVLPDGRRTHSALEARIKDAYLTGTMPAFPMLGPGPAKED
jgi:hypothetical protein